MELVPGKAVGSFKTPKRRLYASRSMLRCVDSNRIPNYNVLDKPMTLDARLEHHPPTTTRRHRAAITIGAVQTDINKTGFTSLQFA